MSSRSDQKRESVQQSSAGDLAKTFLMIAVGAALGGAAAWKVLSVGLSPDVGLTLSTAATVAVALTVLRVWEWIEQRIETKNLDLR